MKALSVRQPWAWAIINCGKEIENRSRRFHHRGPLLIHASKRKPTRKEMESFLDLRIGMIGDLAATNEIIHGYGEMVDVRGAIIGQVDVMDCVTKSTSPWFVGPYGLVLANPKPLPFRAYKGRLGLFEVE